MSDPCSSALPKQQQLVKGVNDLLFDCLHLSFVLVQIRYNRLESSAVGHLRISPKSWQGRAQIFKCVNELTFPCVQCCVPMCINSELIQAVPCGTECRLSVSLHSAECTHMMQPAQHLQCRMPNTKTTKHVLNTQGVMCFRCTCQSPNTSSYCQCCL